jgi:hypothetical protein
MKQSPNFKEPDGEQWVEPSSPLFRSRILLMLLNLETSSVTIWRGAEYCLTGCGMDLDCWSRAMLVTGFHDQFRGFLYFCWSYWDVSYSYQMLHSSGRYWGFLEVYWSWFQAVVCIFLQLVSVVMSVCTLLLTTSWTTKQQNLPEVIDTFLLDHATLWTDFAE